MNIELGTGARGIDVKRLHCVLVSEAHHIDRREFGASTLAALQAFQLQHGLQPTEAIDAATFELLLQFEQNIIININEGATSSNRPAPSQNRGITRGKLVDEDGAPAASMAVALVAKQIRSETPLGNTTKSQIRQYSITYARNSSFNLIVRASQAKGLVVAESATVFVAPGQVEIDLTTAKDGVVRTPSAYIVLSEIEPQLQENVHAESDGNQGQPRPEFRD
jgi:hypothetical protein